jgi:kinesin family protein 12
LSLKREVNSLKMENEHLKTLTVFHRPQLQIDGIGAATESPDHEKERASAVTPAPKVDMDRLAELENNELSELVKLYMSENHALRHENNELYSARDNLLRDQESVCRENERLLKKLEDVNSVCCRSPLIPARPTISGDIFNFSNGSESDFVNNSNIWRNPLGSSTENLDGRISSADTKITDNAQREMDKLRITDRYALLKCCECKIVTHTYHSASF